MKLSFTLCSALSLAAAVNGVAFNGFRTVLYAGDWKAYSTLDPQKLPYDDVTHLVYSFGNITDDGTANIFDTYMAYEKRFGNEKYGEGAVAGLVNQFWEAKQAHRNLKVMLAVGGWNGRERWAPIMNDPKKRANFVTTVSRLIMDVGFDGIDIDWEYPNTEQSARDAVSLLQELRAALDHLSDAAMGYHFTLSIASPADPKKYQYFDFKAMDEALDFWSIMTYDFSGSWDETAGHSSNLFPDSDTADAVKYNIHRAVVDYLKAGVDPRKITIGLPLYGHVFPDTDGLGKLFRKPSELEGTVPINKLPRTPNAKVHYDEKAMAEYSYDESTRELISYDDAQSIADKIDYIYWIELGGAMFWEASQDRLGAESIVSSVARKFAYYEKMEESENNVYYPDSKWTNIRAISGSNN